MYDPILLPTDGSTVAETATEAAVNLAGRFDARLHVVYVLESGDLPSGYEDEDTDAVGRRGEEATAAAAERAAEADIEVTTALLEETNSVHRAIRTYADTHGIECIVMGTYGRTGLDRFVLGSVAERTLRESSIPVLTVHEETTVPPAFETILVPTDGSESAEAAADEAIELARYTGGALHVIHVVDGRGVGTDANVGTVLDSLEAAGKRAIQRVLDRADEAGVSPVEASVLDGAPHRSIVEYADDRDVDCIVMGTHGRTGFERYILGSVTERVVRLSDVPVLTTKDVETTLDA